MLPISKEHQPASFDKPQDRLNFNSFKIQVVISPVTLGKTLYHKHGTYSTGDQACAPHQIFMIRHTLILKNITRMALVVKV